MTSSTAQPILDRPAQSEAILRDVPEFIRKCLLDEAGIVFTSLPTTDVGQLNEWLRREDGGSCGAERAACEKIAALLVFAHRGTAGKETLQLIVDAAHFGLPGFCANRRIIVAGLYALGRIAPALAPLHFARREATRMIDLYLKRTRDQDHPDCQTARWAAAQLGIK